MAARQLPFHMTGRQASQWPSLGVFPNPLGREGGCPLCCLLLTPFGQL